MLARQLYYSMALQNSFVGARQCGPSCHSSCGPLFAPNMHPVAVLLECNPSQLNWNDMTNFAATLRQEIARLSRKETRTQIDPTRRSALQHRKDVAQLKRRMADLERSIKHVLREVSAPVRAPASDASETRIRFVAK